MSVLETQDQGAIVLAQQDYIPLIVEFFLVDRRAQAVSAETLSFYQKKLKYFWTFCEAQAVTQVSELTPDLIRRYILQLAETHNQGGVHACFRPLRTLLLWVESEEIMPNGWRTPIRKVKAPKLTLQPIEPIALDDAACWPRPAGTVHLGCGIKP